MSNFKSKYEESLKAGDLLVQKEYYNVSIHCYYYACVQLMLHILCCDLGMTDKEIEEEQKNTNIEGGFHNWIINKFFILFLQKDNSDAGREFNNWIGEIRKVRVKADYKNIIIDKAKANDAKQRSFYVIETLKNNFQI